MNKPHLVPIRLCLLSTSLRKGLFPAATTALATSLLAMALSASAAAKAPPIPTLTNTAIDMGLGAGAGAYSPVIGQYPTFTGQSTGLVVDPNTGNIYYSNYLGDIHVVTPSTDAATAKDVTIDPDYAVVYAETPNSTLVESVITPIATQCQNFGVVNGLGIDTVTQNVFVPCGGENVVYVVNEATNNIVATIPVAKNPWAVLADETTGTLYVTSSQGTNLVSVISEKTNTVTATIPVGKYLEYLALDKKNHQLFVSDYTSGVYVIDTKTNTVKSAPQLIGLDAAALAFDSKTEKLYVANYFQGAPNAPAGTVGSFYVIDAKTLNVITIINAPVGCNPLFDVADSAHGTVYALCYGQNFAAGKTGLVIDEKTDTVTGTFNTLPNPLTIALNPKTNQLLVGGNTGRNYGGISIYNTNQ